MIHRIFFVCLSLSLFSAGCSLSCRWMDHKFKQYSGDALELLDKMVNNSTNSTEDAAAEDTVPFPNHLYNLAFNALSDEDKLAFTVQILKKTADLFKEDYSSASWEENTVENFVGLIDQQAEGLHACIGSPEHKWNKKLRMYFKRLSDHILKKMGHSAEAWELIRKAVKDHLERIDMLISPLIRTN